MPQGLHFENLQDSLSRLPGVIQSIPDVVRDPSANPLQAAILLSMLVVIILVVLLSVVLIFLRPADEDDFYYDEAEATGAAGAAGAATAPRKAPKPQRQPMSWLTVACLIVLLVAAVWTVAGITTASSDVCRSCHTDTIHDTAKIVDPHKDVQCVSCHESGGPVARATVNLGTRIEHVILGRTESPLAKNYGRPVASDACLRCHQDQMNRVTVTVATQVKVAHAQPLDAGAQCSDCHVLTDGVVGRSAVGMTPCLRCHDGKQAKAECSTCHIGDPTKAIVANVDTGVLAASQVPNPDCRVCHFDMTKCNNCHGIPMPHSAEFMAYSHARQGAIDIWFNEGRTCAKCHYPGHRNCVEPGCHQVPVPSGHPNPAWATLHQTTPWSTGPKTACSCHGWNPYDHNGMIYCQICHPTKPPTAVP